MAVNIDTLITGSMVVGSNEVIDLTKTRFTFADGTVEEYDWSGMLGQLELFDAEIYDVPNEEWLKNPTAVEIGTNVTGIDDYLFSNCRSLTSVKIPDEVYTIGEDAFAGCSSLNSIEVGANNQAYASVNGMLLSKNGRTLIRGISGSNPNIPSGVTRIGASAFDCLVGLTELSIPDSVTSIGSFAFTNCTNLADITIGSGVESIGDYAFYGCKNLVEVVIPESVELIGEDAFSGYEKLSRVVFQGKTLSYVQSMDNYYWGISDTSIIEPGVK